MINKFTRKRLLPDDTRKPFDCGDVDLNDFFLNDSAGHSRHLLTVTYSFESDIETAAFFSVLNDKIQHRDSDNGKFRHLQKSIPNSKRRKTYPAVKIGRLAVNKKYQRQDFGTAILDYIKFYFIDNNKTGCRFITVDAYRNDCTTSFYIKNGFKYLTDKDKESDTRAMYYDLMPLAKKYYEDLSASKS